MAKSLARCATKPMPSFSHRSSTRERFERSRCYGCRDGYKGFVLGYNSDAKAAAHAQQELQDAYGSEVFCVKVSSAALTRH